MTRGMLLPVALILTVSCAVAGQKINCMVVGDKVLELSENRQLTHRADGPLSGICISPNGANVACYFSPEIDDEGSIPFRAKLLLAPTSGSRAITLVNCPTELPEPLPDGYEQWLPGCSMPGTVAWSPNSRLIAFPAVHITFEGKDDEGNSTSTNKVCIVVMDTMGKRQAVFPLDGEGGSPGCIAWSPDSRRIACVTIRSADAVGEEDAGIDSRVCLLDTTTGSIETVCSERNREVSLLGWQDNGRALLTVETTEEQNTLCERPLDGQPVRVISKDYDWDKSPNGVYRLLPNSESGTHFEECATGKTIRVLTTPSNSFAGWAPASDLFAYTRTHGLTDENRMRGLMLYELWIACVADQKLNHMCVALDVEPESEVPPSWSKDCTKLAYASQGLAYVAEMAWREPEATEKAAAGLPLSEEEQKEALTENAWALARGIQYYSFDHDGQFPSAETLSQDIAPYLGELGLMMNPEAGQYTIQYFRPPTDQVESGTVIAVLDAGFSWRVEVDLSGHSEVVTKQ